MPRLVQRYPSGVKFVLELLELEGLLALLAEVLEPLLLLDLEQVDCLDVGLDVLALGAGPANLVVVGSDSCDLLEDTSPLVRGHRGERGDIALLHDVVAASPETGFG